jgi:phage baseplate assembly protein W
MAYEITIGPSINLEQDVAVGVKLPFVKKDGGLFDSSYTTTEQAISNLKNLILTRKGERYYLPEFGTDIHNILFENDVASTRQYVYETITTAIEDWLPYIGITSLEVSQLDSTTNPNISGYTVSLKVSVHGVNYNTPISFTITS